MRNENEIDVVVIGAGPIGLAHAWAMAQLNKNFRFYIYDKYPTYSRTHTLVMLPKPFEDLLLAAEAPKDHQLYQLVSRLKKDPHIRTNELQEILKKALKDCLGDKVSFVSEEITPENLDKKIASDLNVKIVLGADGTHSVVNKSKFQEGNQVKKAYDYVLQLRYELEGEHRPYKFDHTAEFYQQMAYHGLIANEYVGHTKDNKTPVTMQVMIPQEIYSKLSSFATSKNPINISDNRIPKEIKDFLTSYLKLRIEKTVNSVSIKDDKLSVSVNEAPATYAKKEHLIEDEKLIKLVGDAALGLSYFKGLNAGIEATAMFINCMKTWIKNDCRVNEERERGLSEYSSWFKIFAQQKVKEVGTYSRYLINLPWKLIQVSQQVINSSILVEPSATDSMLLAYNKLKTKTTSSQLPLYPHRKITPGTIDFLKPMPAYGFYDLLFKLFVDYLKPYKTVNQIRSDFIQPFTGIFFIASGLVNIMMACIRLDFKRFINALSSLIYGIFSIITTPLSWFVKPLTRCMMTAIYMTLWDAKKVEDSQSLKNLVALGLQEIDAMKQKNSNPVNDSAHPRRNANSIRGISSEESMYRLRAIIEDIHRKFDKALEKGQSTSISRQQEYNYYNVSVEQLDETACRTYFNLF